MRKLIAITQLTLDGVMQAPGGPDEDTENGIKHGGWFMTFGDDVLFKILHETIGGEFDLLLGRKTYDIWTGYWPHHDDNPVGRAFNRATKFVVTHRPDSLSWKTSSAVTGDIAAELRRLKKSNGPELHLWGSSVLLQTLIAADLVDEHRLWIVPITLGSGKRLFETGVPPRTYSLVDSVRTTTGVLLNTYRPAGPVKITPA